MRKYGSKTISTLNVVCSGDRYVQLGGHSQFAERSPGFLYYVAAWEHQDLPDVNRLRALAFRRRAARYRLAGIYPEAWK